MIWVGGAIDSSQDLETWRWTLDEGWEQLGPANSPPGREDFAVAFDAQRGRAVLHGGTFLPPMQATPVVLNDVWEWDGQTWTQIQNVTGPARLDHSMVYDVGRAQVLAVGGSDGMNPLQQTHAWDSAAATWRLITSASPSVEHPLNGTATYDRRTGQLLLVGAEGSWLMPDDRWQRIGEEMRPPPRFSHSLAFDSAQGQPILFGGRTGDPIIDASPAERLNDVWAWNGAGWTELMPAAGPSPRYLQGVVGAPGGGLLLYGGRGEMTSQPSIDTWAWSGLAWQPRMPLMNPGPSADVVMAADPVRSRVVALGPQGTWEWDGAQWALANGPGMPPPTSRLGAAMAYDEARQQMVFFGGATEQHADGRHLASDRDRLEPCARRRSSASRGARDDL